MCSCCPSCTLQQAAALFLKAFFGEKVLCREHSQGLGGLLWRKPRSCRLGVQAEPEGHWRVAVLGCHLRLNADIPAAWKYA